MSQDKLILNKRYTVAVYDLRMCAEVDLSLVQNIAREIISSEGHRVDFVKDALAYGT